ncbi:hypothetical protein LC653_23840 [Nostoc sp. CHAB 5784]|uniref:hypothetical protein n=1 Tax=Nostoc mirabile TaxID=2907820 RepID=UPI001E35A8EF|nr:hypothetical protein [Nostoc mirabile]MCC5666841.1 hypothetical protein [Nostoc mirabile CHAB5784]
MAACFPQSHANGKVKHLSGINDPNLFNLIQTYTNVFNFSILDINHTLNPLYTLNWDTTFANAVQGAAQTVAIIGYATQNLNNLNSLRLALHNIDGAANPNAANFINPLQIIGNTLAGPGSNPQRIGIALQYLARLNMALPNANNWPNNLPYGNRGTAPYLGLRGHFKKHVLGLHGDSDDANEPPLWYADLNLGANVTRADFGQMTKAVEWQLFGVYPQVRIIGDWYKYLDIPRYFANRIQMGAHADQLRFIQYFSTANVNDVYADLIAAQHEHRYNNYVSNAFDHATNSYIYVDQGRIKINAYQNTDFIIAAFEAGGFNFSSCYKPQIGGQQKYNVERGNRLWEV